MLYDILDEAVDDQCDRLFFRNAALHGVELLVVGNLRGGRLVFDLCRLVLHLDVRHGMRTALVADEERIAVGEVARVLGTAVDRHLTTIGILRHASGNALGNDTARRVLAEMNHFGA
ncbi:hypothetical protein D3C73_911200 [compost metagenome]